ncbi:MAG: hypothetical protein E7J86_13245 [Aeromonas caviae]|nr:hypothetical protein [Aeromonas caviae]
MDKSIRVGIITGIIASMVFVYFLDPIIRVFGEGVLYISKYIVTGLFDSLYQKCALGVAKDPALSIYSMLVGVIVGFPTATLSILIQNREKKTESNESTSSRSKKIVAIIFIVILPIMLFYQFWVMLFQYEVVTSFDQHMRILAPYMDSEQKVIIESNFASMQKEEDYRELYKKLNELAEKNNVLLPVNPSYGLWAL